MDWSDRWRGGAEPELFEVGRWVASNGISIDSTGKRLRGGEEAEAGTSVNLLGSCHLHADRVNGRVHVSLFWHSTTLSG
jgi:hypothetical protein